MAFIKAALSRTLFFLFCFFFASPLLANTEMPDYYNEPGYSPVRQSGQEVFNDNVDPFSGHLTIAHTDLSIPGDGGFDLNIVRSYSSYRAGKPTSNAGRSIVGQGWDIHMGRIYFDNILRPNLCRTYLLDPTSENNPVLELPDGTRKIFYADGNRFITKDFWIGRCVEKNYSEGGRTYNEGGMIVTSPEGIVYRFDRRALGQTGKPIYVVTRIEDPRNNYINIQYRSKPSTGTIFSIGFLGLIERITSSGSGAVIFNYTDSITGIPVIRNISGAGKSITYNYLQDNNFLYLDRVSSSGSIWRFKYHPYFAPICGGSTCTPSNYQRMARSNKIHRITSPLGAIARYDYNFIPSGVRNGVVGAVTERIISGNPSGTWNYDYNMGSSYDETTITTPISTEVYRHFGANAASNGSAWRIGTLLYKSISGGGVTQTETYDWSSFFTLSNQDEKRITRETLRDTSIRVPLLGSKTIRRDNTSYTTIYENYDEYGFPRRITESSGAIQEESIGSSNSRTTNTKVTNIRYRHDTSNWILGLPENEINSGRFNTSPQFGETNWNNEIDKRYYSNGSLRTITDNNVTTVYTYDSNGNVRTVRDANDHVTTYLNYYRGVPRSEIRPENINIVRTVNSLGRVTSITNGRNYTKVYDWDDLNRLRGITPEINIPITINWPSMSRRELTRGGFGEVKQYDDLGYEASLTIQGEETITLVKDYDVMGRLRFESYPNSSTGVTYQYDALDRIKRKEEPGGKVQIYNYKSSNRVDITDGLGNTTQYFYRAFGNPDELELIGIVEPEGTITQVRRDIAGNIVRLNQNGIVRVFRYDNRKFLDSETNPETGLTDYGYDNVGNLTSKEVNSLTSGSAPIVYSYDDDNRLDLITYPALYYVNNVRQSAPVGSCQAPCTIKRVNIVDDPEYDNNDNLEQSLRRITNVSTSYPVSGSPTVTTTQDIYDWSYVYDENDNLRSESLSNGINTYSFGYNFNGLDALSSMTYPTGLSVSYLPDNYNRPTQIGNFASNINYYPTGSISSFTYANGITYTGSLDQRYKVDGVSFSSIGALDYRFNEVDNISHITNTVNVSGNKVLGYDGQNRLRTASGSWGNATFNYDVNNNLSFKSIAGASTTLRYDSSNKLENYSVDGALRTIGYDIYGNITNRNGNLFDYDHQGNLLAAVTAGVNYHYDANNRRVREMSPNSTNFTFYGRSGALLYEQNLSGDTRSEYIYLGSSLIAKRTNSPEPDADNDGVPDSIDAFPNDPNESVDTDGDGIGNNADTDDDGDGIPDALDAFPLDSSESVDTDGDGIGNNADTDDDGDGVPDINDAFPLDASESADSDGDGVGDNADAFPNDASETMDSDGDGIGDNQEIAILITIITSSLMLN